MKKRKLIKHSEKDRRTKWKREAKLCNMWWMLMRNLFSRTEENWKFQFIHYSVNSSSCITALLWQSSLCDSLKLWAMHAGLPRTDGSQCRVLIKRGPLGEETTTHSRILAKRTPWTIWKGKKIWHQNMSPPGKKISNMLLGKNRGQFLIAPKRIKQLDQSRNDAQLCLLVKVKFSVVKNSIA